jgi:nicotinic acetylcholine receptor
MLNLAHFYILSTNTTSLILQQIVGVDEKNQIIEVNAWIKYTWNDYKLKWSPEEYGGVVDVRCPTCSGKCECFFLQLRFPVDMIWRPDVLVYNSADTEFDSTYPSNIIVYSNGDVLWIPPGILRTSCKIDIQWCTCSHPVTHLPGFRLTTSHVTSSLARGPTTALLSTCARRVWTVPISPST